MYRRYPTRRRRVSKRRPTAAAKKRLLYKRRNYYRKKKYALTPRLSPRSITVPVARARYITLSTTDNVIADVTPVVGSSFTFNKFGEIYNKFRVMSITVNVVPHQNAAYFKEIQGASEPLKYVVYRVAPDTIGTSTNPTSYKEAMMMPGAKAYNLTQTCTRKRVALMGVVRNYCNNASFTVDNTVAVRQACRAPWLSTQMSEADDPFLYGWAVWFPQLSTFSTTVDIPTFEIINIMNVRFISAMNLVE